MLNKSECTITKLVWKVIILMRIMDVKEEPADDICYAIIPNPQQAPSEERNVNVDNSWIKQEIAENDPEGNNYNFINIKSEELDIKEEELSINGESGVQTKDSADKNIFECDKCDKNYTSKRSLILHLKIHSEKAFNCRYCDYKNAYKRNLKSHLKIHTRRNLFECSICEYKTAYKHSLKGHLKSHITEDKPYLPSVHSKQDMDIETEEKLIKCGTCEFTTANHSLLKYHVRTCEKHYVCSVCGFRAARQHHLNIHFKIHKAEKPFACSLCEFRTTRSQTLRYHMTIHTMQKPHDVMF